MQAMILAAGFGTRLLPFTRLRPKPLFPLFNRALLLFTIDRLKACGCSRIIVNCHHLKEQIVAALADHPGVYVQEEEIILGTGGGLRRALALMNDEPLLITNGDIYHTIDLEKLYRQHREEGHRVTLAVHDYPRFNTIAIDNDIICGFASTSQDSLLAFTGVHVVQPEVLEPIAEHQQSCIIDRYRQMLKEDPAQLYPVRVDGAYWCDMGTPADYLALQGGLLSGTVPLVPEMTEYGSSIGDGRIFSHSPALLPADLHVEGWASIGAARIGKNVTIRRSIIWDGAHIADNAIVEDCIVAEEDTRE